MKTLSKVKLVTGDTIIGSVQYSSRELITICKGRFVFHPIYLDETESYGEEVNIKIPMNSIAYIQEIKDEASSK